MSAHNLLYTCLIEREKRTEEEVLVDITQRELQTFIADDEVPIPTPGVTPRTPATQIQPVVRLRYEQPSPWSPPTPPSSGRERSTRSASLSPWKLLQTPAGLTRTSPRKRLQLTPETVLSSPKRMKVDSAPTFPPLDLALKGLSHDQLVNLVQKLATGSLDLKSKIEEILPLPDLHVRNDEMKQLRICVQKSLPSVSKRITSKTDAVAFSRAQVHVHNLKKYILETASTLVKSEYWLCVVDFVFLAWIQMRLTPNWDNEVHNSMKKKCYRVLTAHLTTALKNGTFSGEELLRIGEQVNQLRSDFPGMEACVKLIESRR